MFAFGSIFWAELLDLVIVTLVTARDTFCCLGLEMLILGLGAEISFFGETELFGDFTCFP